MTIQVDDAKAAPEDRPLMKYADKASDLPADASRSIDRLLYGERR